MTPQLGDVFNVQYPFVRDVFRDIDMDTEGYPDIERPTWKPGTNVEQYSPDDFWHVADGLGVMVLTVVSVHKPGKFPTRVFYTRSWVNPDGKTFGKGACRIATVGKFRRLAKGYLHDYELATQKAAR